VADQPFDFDAVDWDDGNLAKLEKHLISKEEVEEALESVLAVVDDPSHSLLERRLRAVGRTQTGRWVFVALTVRERDGAVLVRPISARYMHAREIARYA
jgi:uncharacterized DUF497 family protein